MIEITDFTDANSSADMTPAFTRAFAAISAQKVDRTLHIPAGSHLFRSPLPQIPFNLNIVGEGQSVTVLRKMFNGSHFFHFTGETGDGGGMRDLSLLAEAGYTPGNALVVKGSSTRQPSRLVFRDLNITGPGLWFVPVLLDGSERVGGGGLSVGLRSMSLSNIWVFNAIAASVWMRSVIGLNMIGGGIFAGSGPLSACGLWITGTDQVRSEQVDVSAFVNNGMLNITNATMVRYIGSMASLQTDASSRCVVIGQCDDASGNRLTNSTVILN